MIGFNVGFPQRTSVAAGSRRRACARRDGQRILGCRGTRARHRNQRGRYGAVRRNFAESRGSARSRIRHSYSVADDRHCSLSQWLLLWVGIHRPTPFLTALTLRNSLFLPFCPCGRTDGIPPTNHLSHCESSITLLKPLRTRAPP